MAEELNLAGVSIVQPGVIPLGLKYDNNKLRWDLLPITEVEDIVKILTFGAAKYADNNWQLVANGTERYYAAMLRHLVAWRKGELIDPESGESHLSHAACCLIFLMWLDKQNEKTNGLQK